MAKSKSADQPKNSLSKPAPKPKEQKVPELPGNRTKSKPEPSKSKNNSSKPSASQEPQTIVVTTDANRRRRRRRRRSKLRTPEEEEKFERDMEFIWCHDRVQNEKEARRALDGKPPKRELPKCTRVGKNHVRFEFKDSKLSKTSVVVQHIDEPKIRLYRRAMQVSGIVPDGGFDSDLTDDLSSPSASEKASNGKKKVDVCVELIMKTLQTREEEKKKKEFMESAVKKTVISQYVMPELNDNSSYFMDDVMKSEGVLVKKAPEHQQESVGKFSVDSKGVNDSRIASNNSSQIVKDPNASVKKAPEALKKREGCDTKIAKGFEGDKVSKIPEDVRDSDEKKLKEDPEIVTSNYISIGLNHRSDYCSQKMLDSNFSTTKKEKEDKETIMKTLADSGVLNFGKSEPRREEKKTD